ncbi:MAG: phage Gp37/Gp68 family protein [Chloroflexi bacterium]|nr:phage Gp37/Gp68 family protein [Chloroflexota bacterium]
MAALSSIEWTQSTWNPVTGCSKVSPACKNCYAERMALRLQAMGHRRYANGFKSTMHYQLLSLPLKWKKPQMIFVNSMSDLFHEEVSEEFILSAFDTMKTARWHNYQILTKRTERLVELDSKLPWAENVWMGVSVENEDYTFRIDHLRNTGAKVKFLSLEPLLGPIPSLNLEGIDWVIVGGESGPRPRKMEMSWVLDIRDKCQNVGISFFFKQWGGRSKRKSGRELEGRTWDEIPAPKSQNL